MRLQKRLSCSGGMTGAAVADQMNASKGVKKLQQTRQSQAEMFTVIVVQTVAAHLATEDVEQSQEIDDTISLVFKFRSQDLARAHGLCGTHSLQRLNIWLLVQGQNDFTLRQERFGPFIITTKCDRRAPGTLRLT